MQRTRSVITFLLTAAVFALPAAYLAFSTGKLALHAELNTYHAAWSDLFFRYATHLADGLVPLLLALLLLFFRDLRSFMMMAVSATLSGIVLQLLKRQVFGNMHRPGMFRKGLDGMHWVDGIDLNMHFSFPSGHSTVAFSMCLALAVIFGKPKWAAMLALVAVLLAYSRIYLSQHFVQDTLAGAALGSFITVLVFLWLYRSEFAKQTWLDKRVFRTQK